MSADLIEIEWLSRAEALAPAAVIAFGETAITLAAKLLAFEDEWLQNLQGTAAERMILLLGDADFLPWTDGVVYLGRDSLMPSVLLPTTLRPAIPFDFFQPGLNENFKAFAPFAVLPEKIIPFGKARVLSRRILESWLAENR